MPKPQSTYLQTMKIAKIALRARHSKNQRGLNMITQKRERLRGLDLSAARNTAYLAHDFGSESSSRGNAIRKLFGELVDQLNDFDEQLHELSELHTEIREPLFEYRAVTHNQARISAVNIVEIAMVAIVLIMVLEKRLFGGGK